MTRFAEVAACLAPAPGPAVQLATAAFMRDGHYMRHLRRTKRVYATQGDALLKCLRPRAKDVVDCRIGRAAAIAGWRAGPLVARETLSFGLAPTPLSLWYASPAVGAIRPACWASPLHRKRESRRPATGSFGSLTAPGDERSLWSLRIRFPCASIVREKQRKNPRRVPQADVDGVETSSSSIIHSSPYHLASALNGRGIG